MTYVLPPVMGRLTEGRWLAPRYNR